MTQLTLGAFARSGKENERRLPIHPQHLRRIDADLRSAIYLEIGYGERFGVADDELARSVAGVLTRDELIARCDVILLPKPQHEDLERMRVGQVLWGWPHCVQDDVLTQLAIDKRLTLIAFEAMNHWADDGSMNLHVFHKNNELAGYCSVIHALEIVGRTGDYGRRLTAAVIGFGATARGAVTALKAHGVNKIDVLTHRGVSAVASPIHSTRLVHLEIETAGNNGAVVDGVREPLAGFLAGHDMVVNCVLQDPNDPMMFLRDADLATLRPGSIVVDVSCDEGMGFSWARPTSFSAPTFVVGNHVTYYAVDHSPSYLWDSASWEVSEALLPHLRSVLGGPTDWDDSEVIRRAIEVREGTVLNPAVLTFQNRSPNYPHARS